MPEQPKIDKDRLEALKQQRAAAISACRASGEIVRTLVDERSVVESEISRLKADVQQLRRDMGAAELRRKVSELETRCDALSARIEEAALKGEPLSERRNSINVLYRRCAEFMGVDPYA